MDSLKVGIGKKNGYTMLKETKHIGVVFIESIYMAPEATKPEVEEVEAKPEVQAAVIQPV